MNKKFLLIGVSILLFACLTTVFLLSRQQKAERQSLYVTMSDGTDIAIDLWLPKTLQPEEKIPTIVRATPYWRSYELTPVGEFMGQLGLSPNESKEQNIWAQAGYALVLVDVRGTGASFGQWEMIWSETEIADLGEVMDWIVAQTWSNGSIGAYGVSYEGNTAEMMASLQHPALKAVAPQYSDFDLYNNLVRPGGVFNQGFMSAWNAFHNGLIQNDVCALEPAAGVACEQMSYMMTGVRPVDADVDKALLSNAVSEHTEIDVYQITEDIEFSDDSWGETESTLADVSPFSKEAANVPMYVRVGWLDSITADGALSRYQTFSNPQKVMIGPWSHGGGHHIDPFLPADAAVEPSVTEQYQLLVDFFDLHLKSEGEEKPDTGITYYTLGEGTWKETQTWPPAGFTPQTWYFGENGRLTSNSPDTETGADEYTVNWDVSTGDLSRWYTGLYQSDVVYPDRAQEDAKLLTYTSEPLDTAVEITGNPIVTLHVASSTPDAAFHVYLEDVAPDGRVTYITEGILRGTHRELSAASPPYIQPGPYHTMTSDDAQMMTPGQVTELRFKLYATSVLIKEGHRLRVAIAGYDDASFARYPVDETPTFTVQRNKITPSSIVLPVQER